MRAHSLFRSSPIPGISLFHYPLPYPAADDLPPTRLPIGKQMELRLLAALEADPRYEVLAHGLQIQDDGITRGELDFLIRDTQDGQMLHIELVHKYYIYDPALGESEHERWIGPNYKDRLSYKLEKLRDHQFPLLQHPLTRPYLSALGLAAEQIAQRLCFSAELYAAHDQQVTPNESSISPEALRGKYYRYSQASEALPAEAQYYLCSKQDWICTASAIQDWAGREQLLSSSAVQALQADGRATMIWIRGGAEIERAFLIPDRPKG